MATLGHFISEKILCKSHSHPPSPDPFFFFWPSGEISQHKKKPEPNTMTSCPKVDSGTNNYVFLWSLEQPSLHAPGTNTQKVAPKGCSPSSRANALLLALPTKARILCLDSL